MSDDCFTPALLAVLARLVVLAQGSRDSHLSSPQRKASANPGVWPDARCFAMLSRLCMAAGPLLQLTCQRKGARSFLRNLKPEKRTLSDMQGEFSFRSAPAFRL